MATRLWSVVIDSTDPSALADWWARALDWPIVRDEPDEVVVAPEKDHVEDLSLVFGSAPEPEHGKNRVHLDLGSRSTGHQTEIVERLVAAGARHVDIGQVDVPWVVLADPEGNELCVLDPDDRFDPPPVLAAIVVDVRRPAALAPFWAEATGWHIEASSGMVASLRHPSSLPPALDLVAVDAPTPGKNRVHLDVAPEAGDDHAAAVERLLRLGARHVDVGQGPDVPWVVLADPEDNELCVLSPR